MLVKSHSNYFCSHSSPNIVKNIEGRAKVSSPNNYTEYAPLFYTPLSFTGAEKVLNVAVSKIKAKSNINLDLLTTFYHPKADGKGMEKLLAFHSCDTSNGHNKLGIHLFSENEKLLGQIIATTDNSAFKLKGDTMNPFVKRGEKYIYIETVDNFANIKGDRAISWEKPVCEDFADKKYKGIGSKLYELMAGHIAKLGIDDNRGFACMARVESGSVDFHSKLGFNSYGYTLERESNGWLEPWFDGMATTEAAFNNLKKKGLALLNRKS